MCSENLFGKAIYSYPRKQDIQDGILVDLSEIDSIKRHWKHPFACTSTTWAIALEKPGQNCFRHLHRHCYHGRRLRSPTHRTAKLPKGQQS